MRKRFYIKKKGFTLIELLAVIVILAVILLIVVPIVLNVIGDARKGAFESSAMGLVKTAENACMSYALRHDPVARETLFSDGEMSGHELKFTGKPPVGGYVYINEQCEIQLAVHNNEWCAIKDYDELEVTLVPYDGDCSLEEIMAGGYPILQWQIESYESLETVPPGWIGVWTAEDLKNVENDLSGNYIQMANIDLASFTNWEPIGYGTAWQFLGHYDGNGYTISNMTIDRSDTIGLFAQLGDFAENQGVLENIQLIDINVIGTNIVGGLVGMIAHGTVENCSVSGYLAGNARVGSIAGEFYNGIISKTFANVEIEGIDDWPFNIGGLVGDFPGFAFQLPDEEDGIIINSYFSGSIDATDEGGFVGGLVGRMGASWNPAGIIENSYAVSSINADYTFGGLIGNSSGLVLNSYYDSEASNLSDIGKGEPRLTEEMTSPYNSSNTYIDWDFDNVWTFSN